MPRSNRVMPTTKCKLCGHIESCKLRGPIMVCQDRITCMKNYENDRCVYLEGEKYVAPSSKY